MAWRVTRDGAMLEVVTGSRVDAAGRDVEETEVRTFRRGQVLVEALAPDLVKRWHDGDAHLRSVVERIDSYTLGEA